jgi:hypothetical protein
MALEENQAISNKGTTMKKTMSLLSLMLASQMALAQAMSLEQIRSKVPQLYGLDDVSAVKVIQANYYPDIPLEDIAAKLGVVIPPPFVPKTLGPIDKWRYQSCQQDAAEAPTSQGVIIKLRVCREKFGQ